MTITIGNTPSAASGIGFALFSGTNVLHPAPVGMPTLIPASELYFWSQKWQAQEREFERAREAGELIEAASMTEVIVDLMRVDDPDD